MKVHLPQRKRMVQPFMPDEQLMTLYRDRFEQKLKMREYRSPGREFDMQAIQRRIESWAQCDDAYFRHIVNRLAVLVQNALPGSRDQKIYRMLERSGCEYTPFTDEIDRKSFRFTGWAPNLSCTEGSDRFEAFARTYMMTELVNDGYSSIYLSDAWGVRLSYVEGDVSLVVSVNDAAYHRDRRETVEFVLEAYEAYAINFDFTEVGDYEFSVVY